MSLKFDYYDDITRLNPEPLSLEIRRIVNATCLFIVTFYMAMFLNHLISGFSAKTMGYDPTFRYYEVADLPLDWRKWSQLRILVLYSSGPIFVLLTGLFSWIWYYRLRKKESILKPFSLWLSFNCIIFFLSCITQVVFGTGSYSSPFYTGFSVIASWYWFEKPIMGPASLFGLGLIVLYAFYVTNSFLELSSSASRIKNYYGKRRFLLYNVITPVFFGGAIILILRANKDFITCLTAIFCAGIALFVIWLRSMPKIIGLKIVNRDTLDFPVYLPIGILLLFLASMYLFFEKGVML